MQIASANLAFVWGKTIWKFISFLINSFFIKFKSSVSVVNRKQFSAFFFLKCSCFTPSLLFREISLLISARKSPALWASFLAALLSVYIGVPTVKCDSKPMNLVHR